MESDDRAHFLPQIDDRMARTTGNRDYQQERKLLSGKTSDCIVILRNPRSEVRILSGVLKRSHRKVALFFWFRRNVYVLANERRPRPRLLLPQVGHTSYRRPRSEDLETGLPDFAFTRRTCG